MGQGARRRRASHKGDDVSQPYGTLNGFFKGRAYEVSDEEFNRYAEGNFRFGLRKFIFFEYGYLLVKPTTREESLGVDIASDEDVSAMKMRKRK